MARKGENIRKRKDGRWEGRYKNGINERGTTKYSSVYGKTYKEVKSKLIEIKSSSKAIKKDAYTNMSFQDVLILWLNFSRIKIKRSTEAKYEYIIEKHITPKLGEISILSLSGPIINNFLFQKLQNGKLNGAGGLSPSYVKTMAIIIQSAIQFAANEGWCPPLKTPILKPYSPKNELQILSLPAQQYLEMMLVKNMDVTGLGIYLALHTGMRIGEVCALSWNDIDWENAILHVKHTVARVKSYDDPHKKSMLIVDEPKTKSSVRDIPLSPDLLAILKKMKRLAVSRYVISNQEAFISPRTFDYRYKKTLKGFGLSPINFHGLRHTFATRCIEVGVDTKSLSQILGHSSVVTTLNTYVHPSMETIRVQLEKLSILTL